MASLLRGLQHADLTYRLDGLSIATTALSAVSHRDNAETTGTVLRAPGARSRFGNSEKRLRGFSTPEMLRFLMVLSRERDVGAIETSI